MIPGLKLDNKELRNNVIRKGITQEICSNFDSLPKMTSQLKNKNWRNFLFRRDFDLRSHIF